MKKFFLILILAVTLAQSSMAQTSTGTGFLGFRRGLATVMLAGLGGAVLGLSTLSFYGEPQDHIGNIWVGLAVGALGGTAYVLAQSQSQNQFALESNPLKGLSQRVPSSPLAFQYAWDF